MIVNERFYQVFLIKLRFQTDLYSTSSLNDYLSFELFDPRFSLAMDWIDLYFSDSMNSVKTIYFD